MIEETTLIECIMQVLAYSLGAIALGLCFAYIAKSFNKDKK